MSIQRSIENKLSNGLAPLHMEVINESGMHNVPAGSESHFKVVLVSAKFEGQNLVAQHRLVYSLVDAEMRESVHALALHTYTPAQWQAANGGAPDSPQCLGGKAKEAAAN